jgi:hypothetical protein
VIIIFCSKLRLPGSCFHYISPRDRSQLLHTLFSSTTICKDLLTLLELILFQLFRCVPTDLSCFAEYLHCLWELESQKILMHNIMMMPDFGIAMFCGYKGCRISANAIARDAGTGGQEGQLPLLPFARRGKGGRSAL